jgi:hypothetical protein
LPSLFSKIATAKATASSFGTEISNPSSPVYLHFCQFSPTQCH